MRFKLFNKSTMACQEIVGCEEVQEKIYTDLHSFCVQGQVNKLILLHGANGAAKTSIIETIAQAMSDYSHQEEGGVYRFNWVFPAEPSKISHMKGEAKPIGFGERDENSGDSESYAYLDDVQISCKIPSEFKENPLYLLPLREREQLLKKLIAEQDGCAPEEVKLPPHIYLSGLSKRNQLIFENLLNGYDGNLEEVFRHVQVERFYFSQQYRVGISTVEPQMSIDATEKQLTMERHIVSIPSVLQNFRIHESYGELVEANRGFLEFSDLLKRPLETFKYLLSTVEKSFLNLPSGTMPLDLVFFATVNERHLSAFKRSPEFDSFRERFSLITVPYLLNPHLEKKIYKHDLTMLAREIKIAPHAIEMLCLWGVMTRLKPPDSKLYEEKYSKLLEKIDPRNKIRLYCYEALTDKFTPDEEITLHGIRAMVVNEAKGTVFYEGGFGISPREMRAIIYRASQRTERGVLTVVAIFSELRHMCKDPTVYEFMRIERSGQYHNVAHFLEVIQEEFCQLFYEELMEAMMLIDDSAYFNLISTYVEHVAGDIKKEKILDHTSGELHHPSQKIMDNFEKIIAIDKDAHSHRQSLLNRLASFKLDNPHKQVNLEDLFSDYVKKIRAFYFKEHEKQVWGNFKAILSLDKDKETSLTEEEKILAENTLHNLQKTYNYSKDMVVEQLRLLISFKG